MVKHRRDRMYKTAKGWQFYKDVKAQKQKHVDEKGRASPAKSAVAKKLTKQQRMHIEAVHAMRRQWEGK